MSPSKKGQAESFEYGASVTGENVDFSPDAGIESAGVRDKALMDKLREALKPGDAKKQQREQGQGQGQDTTHDGRHGGIESVMKPGNRDYDEHLNERKGRGKGGVLDSLGSHPDTNTNPKNEGSSILDKFHLGNQSQNQGGEEERRRGGVMNSKKGLGTGGLESHRDSTDTKRADEGRLPGHLYHSIRDDAFK
ncbi:hypothetical protein GGS20DRAFT_556629 [Poronia punctata]|nr:hypothetical protein GGS20DRAFT_556629 [Poronia punctata]